MKVSVAEHAGACYGVERALALAEEAVRTQGRACTMGPLIHNPAVVAALEADGLLAVDDPQDIPVETAVVIRSHGVTPNVRRRLEEQDAEVVDATCPHVLRAQRAAERLAQEGRSILVVGEAGHPEVEGLLAYAHEAGAEAYVVSGAGEIPASLVGSVGVVVQTTQRREVLLTVLEELERRDMDVCVADTVCDATKQRQDAARSLARSVDAMVVVGGRNSSNTARLAEVCQEMCQRTYHVQTASEIDAGWFFGCSLVGVTAGASTPADQIDQVVSCLECL